MKQLGIIKGLAMCILCTGSAFATLIPIGPVSSSGDGIGSVNSVVTFQNTGIEVGCVGVNSSGMTVTGSTVCAGGVTAPGGITNEQTGSGNNTYTAGDLGLTSGGTLTFANVILVFNGNEGGGAGEPITLDKLSLNLFGTNGSVLGTFSTASAYSANAFPGVGNAGFGFQLDATQAASANSILAANSTLRIGASAQASGANAGPETVFISTINSTQPGGGGGGNEVPEPGSAWMLGSGFLGAAFLLKRRSCRA
ncbi:MAG: PEP-CTERM sorting domain-containing protein [Bryobacteraceae bacterium]